MPDLNKRLAVGSELDARMGRKSNGPRYYPSKKTWFANLDGERISLISGPKKATEKRAWELYEAEKEAREGLIAGDMAPAWTILNAHYHWSTTRKFPKPISESTRKNMMLAMNSFADQYGQVLVRDLKQHHIEDWLSSKNTWSDHTCNMFLNIIRAAFRWGASSGGLIGKDPLRHLFDKKGVVRGENKRITISEEEHLLLCQEADKRKCKALSGILQYLWATGARPSEIRLLRVSEWDEERRAYVIKPTDDNEGRYKMRRYGKDRVVYLPTSLLELNREYQAEAQNGLLFCHRRGGTYNKKTLGNAVARRAGRLGLRSGIIPYSYRHSFVTRWLEKGGDPYHLSELLGTSLQMIQRHYSHLFKSYDVLRNSLDRYG